MEWSSFPVGQHILDYTDIESEERETVDQVIQRYIQVNICQPPCEMSY